MGNEVCDGIFGYYLKNQYLCVMEREKDYNSTFELMTAIQTNMVGAYSRLFDIMWNVKVEKEKHLSKLPYHINVIDELHINENAHSRILAKLLQFRDKKGCYAILESFVKFIQRNDKRNSDEFNNIHIVSPVITQEKQRIDLWVRDYKAKPKYALILENKIYDAIDQKSQLFNYIEKTTDCGFSDNEIFVFYLTKYEKEPNNQTWSNDETKQKFHNRYVNLTFRENILEWLKTQVKPNICQEDIYLSSAVTQYIDYLEGLFSIREIYNSINMKLHDIISEKLDLKNCSKDEALNKIQGTIEDLQSVVTQLVSMKTSIRREMWKEYLYMAVSQVSPVMRELGLITDCSFINGQDSRSCISFRKNDWVLSIVLERYDNDDVFIYVGVPGEKRVDEFLNSGIQIFGELRDRDHPYGWDWYPLYHRNPEFLMKDIQNGVFKNNISARVKDILGKIEEQHIKMK